MFQTMPISEELASNLTATPNITTPGLRVTGDAVTAHTKGAYGVLSASLPFDVHGLTLWLSGTATSNTRTDALMDLAIGAANVEQVILPNLLVGWLPATTTGGYSLYLPFFIPKGTRLTARVQGLQLSKTLDILAFFHGAADGPAVGQLYRRADAYGVNTASSTGTSHTPGNSGAESTAASIGGTLTRNYKAIMFMVQGSLATTTMTAIAYHWEMQIGGVTMMEWYHRSHTTEERFGPYPNRPIPHYLPSGTQLQVRAEASGTAIAHDVAFYCFY